MIIYIIFLKAKAFILDLKNIGHVFVNIFLLLISMFYAKMTVLIINKATEGNLGITADKIIFAVTGALAIMTFMRMFIPSYNPSKQIFPKYYPVSKVKQYIATIISEIISPFFAYLVLYLVICTILLYNPGSFLCFAFNAITTAHFLRRIIQYFIDFKIKKISIILMLTFSGIALIFYYYINSFSPHYLFIIPIALIVAGFIFENSIISERRGELLSKNSKNLSNNPYLKMTVNKPSARIPIIVALLFKLIILYSDYFLFKLKGKHLFDSQLICFLFYSPIILFTYVFNNLWGFWRNLWLNFELRSGNYKDLILAALKLQIFPLSFDIVITFSILLLTLNNLFPVFIFYFTSLIFLFCFSIVWSLLFPIYLKSTFQLKGSTSFISTLVSILGILFISLISINIWFYIIVPVFLFISSIAYKFSIKQYMGKKYKILMVK